MDSHTHKDWGPGKVLPKVPVFLLVSLEKTKEHMIRGKQCFLQLHLQHPHRDWPPSGKLASLLWGASVAEDYVDLCPGGLGSHSGRSPNLQQKDTTCHTRLHLGSTRQWHLASESGNKVASQSARERECPSPGWEEHSDYLVMSSVFNCGHTHLLGVKIIFIEDS